jgi:lysophospholipase L1-like esterase
MNAKKKSILVMGIGLILLISVLEHSCSSPPTGTIILCAGDSITEIGYPEFLGRILKKEGIRAKVLNQGKRGYNSKEYLTFLKRNKAAIRDDLPDFICLQLGTNDVRTDHDNTSADEFYANMKEIIRYFRDIKTRAGKNPRILVATVPPIPNSTPFPFSHLSAERVTQEINPLIRKLAQEEKLMLVDNYTVFLRSPDLLPDVHPSDQGYQALAQNWFAALKEAGIKEQ